MGNSTRGAFLLLTWFGLILFFCYGCSLTLIFWLLSSGDRQPEAAEAYVLRGALSFILLFIASCATAILIDRKHLNAIWLVPVWIACPAFLMWFSGVQF
jgi:hypothetical protein